MVFLIRTDLKMKPGKVAAQVAHATLGLYKKLEMRRVGLMEAWQNRGQPKITLKVKDEEEMYTEGCFSYSNRKAIVKAAARDGFETYIVHDAGRTQVPAGSATVASIIGEAKALDGVTGHLSLY